MKAMARRHILPEPRLVAEWNNKGFPTTKTVHPVRCGCCGKTAEATVITVDCLGLRDAHWLVMPAGWSSLLGLGVHELDSLTKGLARCPDCIPQPKRAKV